ncbi:MAG TPA: molybdopterin-dependent oxidoreductase [Gemmatimonadaceae bacterium]|nr:molybdopterin-dependent oxidoreductase [Gemmatimonadaceae bacterium]
MPTRHFRTCSLCEAMCGIVVEHDGDRVLSIRGDPDDPFSRGHLCPKAVALQDLHHDPDRLRTPVRRDGDRWIPIGWDEAFDLVARQLHAVQRAHGRDAVAVYLGNPTAHSFGAILTAPPFVRALRTRNRYSATSVDQLPHHVAATRMFGHGFLIPIPDLDRTQHLLILGANPAASNGSLMTAGNVKGRLEAIRARGGRIVLVDPRRTETAALADDHHFIRPGTDALLLLALLHVIFNEALSRADSLPSFVTGVDEVRQLAQQFPPERVAAATGLRAATIRQMARDFARAERAVCYGRVGVSTQEFGGLAVWLITVLNAITGQLDRPGGAMFTSPAVDVVRKRGGLASSQGARWRSRVRGLPEYGGELPVSALAEEMDTPGEGQVRALVTHAGNPVLSTPNGRRLERAIAGLDFYAAIDFYINETTRLAHVILPPTGPLERDHYDVVFHALAVRNTTKYSPPMVPRPADARHDWEILTALTARLATGSAMRRLRTRAAAALARALGPRRLLDVGLRTGAYGAGWLPFGSGLTVRRLERAPHGIDLGALRPVFPGRLRTRDRTVRLAPAEFLADVGRLERWLEEANGHAASRNSALTLIGRRQLRSNNSWMHNAERLMRGDDRCTLLMHPRDAEAHGVLGARRVRVRSRVGEVVVPLEVSEAMMPGVVSLPHGFGHDRPGVALRVAARHAGASLNDLTDDQRVDALVGTAAFAGVPVEVAPA